MCALNSNLLLAAHERGSIRGSWGDRRVRSVHRHFYSLRRVKSEEEVIVGSIMY